MKRSPSGRESSVASDARISRLGAAAAPELLRYPSSSKAALSVYSETPTSSRARSSSKNTSQRQGFESREDMKRLVHMGMVEGLQEAVSQMDALLAGPTASG
jgi:hypothetical protein